MSIVDQRHWEVVEQWTPQLFLVGSVFELVFAVTHGAAFLVEGFTFIEWIYPTVIFGRLAVLFGLAGLTARIARGGYNRLRLVSRVIVVPAMVSTAGLMILSTLVQFGIGTSVIPVVGISTVLLTLLTFVFFGSVGLSTDAYPSVIGGLLLVATTAVLFVLLGQGAFSVDLRGAVGEGVNAVVFLAVWYVLNTEPEATTQRAPTQDTLTE